MVLQLIKTDNLTEGERFIIYTFDADFANLSVTPQIHIL